MRVALINPPLSGHQHRGSGIYYEQLKLQLSQIKEIDLIFGDWKDVKDKADVYHFAFFDLFFLTLPFRLPKNSVITVHDVIPLRFPGQFPVGIRGKIKSAIQGQILKQAQIIVTDSKASKTDIAKLLNINEVKIQVVYLAPGHKYSEKKSVQQIRQILKKYQIPEKYFIYVGDGNWNKNLPNIIQTALDTNINLVLVGPPLKGKPILHPWTASLVKVFDMIQNQPNIFILNKVPETDLVCLYQGAQALIFPSHYEGFGLPVTEAFASGCPVISSDKGSLNEIVDEAGLIVDPENIEEIKAAVNKLNSSAKFRSELIQKGLEHVTEFNWEKTARQMYEIYNRMVGTQPQL